MRKLLVILIVVMLGLFLWLREGEDEIVRLAGLDEDLDGLDQDDFDREDREAF